MTDVVFWQAIRGANNQIFQNSFTTLSLQLKLLLMKEKLLPINECLETIS